MNAAVRTGIQRLLLPQVAFDDLLAWLSSASRSFIMITNLPFCFMFSAPQRLRVEQISASTPIRHYLCFGLLLLLVVVIHEVLRNVPMS